jgi:hypothetical protein
MDRVILPLKEVALLTPRQTTDIELPSLVTCAGLFYCEKLAGSFVSGTSWNNLRV